MDIFERLENLRVSEGCFNDIMDIVEDIVSYAEQKKDHAKKQLDNFNKTYGQIMGNKNLDSRKAFAFGQAGMGMENAVKKAERILKKAKEAHQKAEDQRVPIKHDENDPLVPKNMRWSTDSHMTKNEAGRMQHSLNQLKRNHVHKTKG